MKKERLENLIDFALKIKTTGVTKMDMKVFDTSKMNEYSRKAKEQWGETTEFKEYEKKSADKSADTQKTEWKNLMLLFAEFGKMKHLKPENTDVQLKVRELQDYITEHFYNCSNDILLGLGKMYASGGEFTENIDNAAGNGTAAFVAKAIEFYCM